MPFIQAYLHCVWTTKYKTPFLCTPLIRQMMWRHIVDYGKSKDIKILSVGGHNDHCHCLIDLSGTQTISDAVGLLKGESSYWINKQKLLFPHLGQQRFSWQHEFWAASFSKDELKKLLRYCANQERHHPDKTLNDEIQHFFPDADPIS